METITKSKTHYRAVMKSDYLGVADLEDFIEQKVELKFTISHVVKHEGLMVAGKKGNFNVAYFTNAAIKPLLMNNVKNCKMMKSITGSPFLEDWKNVFVELYIDETVMLGKENTGGVRIRPGIKTLPKLTEGTTAYNKAVAHIAKGGSWENITSVYEVTKEIKDKIESDATK